MKLCLARATHNFKFVVITDICLIWDQTFQNNRFLNVRLIVAFVKVLFDEKYVQTLKSFLLSKERPICSTRHQNWMTGVDIQFTTRWRETPSFRRMGVDNYTWADETNQS